uniref:Uncharacterized protein n=1 Tax=Parascaris univalens TaxID=6257 RepID=A0A915AB43_PARUN
MYALGSKRAGEAFMVTRSYSVCLTSKLRIADVCDGFEWDEIEGSMKVIKESGYVTVTGLSALQAQRKQPIEVFSSLWHHVETHM